MSVDVTRGWMLAECKRGIQVSLRVEMVKKCLPIDTD